MIAMTNKHDPQDLKQMQSLSLDSKINMTKQRIKDWYESWVKFEIFNRKTEKTRFVTMVVEDYWNDKPLMNEDEYIVTAERGQVYVSFSGGKDSTVLKHIVDSMYSDVPSLFVNTGLEYPEIQKFVRDVKMGKYDCFNSNVEIVRPEMQFNEVLKQYGYPVVSKEVSNTIYGARNSIEKGVYSHRLCKLGISRDEYGGLKDDGKFDYEGSLKNSTYRQDKWKFLLDADFRASSYCCDVMKKQPSKKYEKENGRMPIVGTMAWESQNRRTAWLKNGCNAFTAKRPASQPLSFWTEQDILEYIKKYDVPYCSVYGDVVEQNGELKTTQCSRTGCIFCMFGCHLEKEPNRFQRLKETHPRQYDYCINGGEMVDGKWQPSKEGLGLGKVLDYIGVKYD